MVIPGDSVKCLLVAMFISPTAFHSQTQIVPQREMEKTSSRVNTASYDDEKFWAFLKLYTELPITLGKPSHPLAAHCALVNVRPGLESVISTTEQYRINKTATNS